MRMQSERLQESRVPVSRGVAAPELALQINGSPSGGLEISTESLILAQDERWRRA